MTPPFGGGPQIFAPLPAAQAFDTPLPPVVAVDALAGGAGVVLPRFSSFFSLLAAFSRPLALLLVKLCVIGEAIGVVARLAIDGFTTGREPIGAMAGTGFAPADEVMRPEFWLLLITFGAGEAETLGALLVGASGCC